MKTLDPTVVETAIKRVRSELYIAERSLREGDAQACWASLERLQHKAFEAKVLFQGQELPERD